MSGVNNPTAAPSASYKIKTSDETISNSVTYQDDDALAGLSYSANVWYKIDCVLAFTCTVSDTEDVKYKIIQSAGTAVFNVHSSYPFTDFTYTHGMTYGSTFTGVAGTSAGSYTVVQITGTFKSDTAGTLKVQWAQNAAAATNLVCKAGSYLRIESLA